MSYAANLPAVIAEYKAEIREIERRRWQKMQEFISRVSLGKKPKPKEADYVSARS